jgi:hypothetical protein
MGKRILVAVAVASLLTIAATGCKGGTTTVVKKVPSYADDIAGKADEAGKMADDIARKADEAGKMADDAGGSEPGSVPTPQIDPRDLNDAADAACRAKNSLEGNNTNTEADGSCG